MYVYIYMYIYIYIYIFTQFMFNTHLYFLDLAMDFATGEFAVTSIVCIDPQVNPMRMFRPDSKTNRALQR